jgi:hypothetical protein
MPWSSAVLHEWLRPARPRRVRFPDSEDGRSRRRTASGAGAGGARIAGRSYGLMIAVNAMLAGRYFLGPPGATQAPRALGLAIDLDGGLELRYVDEKRMGKVYVAGRGSGGRDPTTRPA